MAGLCVPSTCIADDFNKIFRVIKRAGKINGSLEVSDKYCWTSDRKTPTAGNWGFM